MFTITQFVDEYQEAHRVALSKSTRYGNQRKSIKANNALFASVLIGRGYTEAQARRVLEDARDLMALEESE